MKSTRQKVMDWLAELNREPSKKERKAKRLELNISAKTIGNYIHQWRKKSQEKPEENTWENTEEIPFEKPEINWEEILYSLNQNTHKNVSIVRNDDEIQYIIFLKGIGNTVFTEDEVRTILQRYSNFDDAPATINELAREFQMSRKNIVDLLRNLGITHDSIPITHGDVHRYGQEQNVVDLTQRKLFGIEQEYKRKKWDEIKKKAKKWEEFEKNRLEILRKSLSNIPVNPLPEIPWRSYGRTGGCSLVFCVSDWQIGQSATAAELSVGEDWSTDKSVEIVRKLSCKSAEIIRNKCPENTEILVMGDIFHGLNGRTAKGSDLQAGLRMDTLRSKQWRAAAQALEYYIQTLSAASQRCTVRCVRGNHEGWDIYPLLWYLQERLKNQSNLDFIVSEKRYLMLRVHDVLLAVDHGASADLKAAVPAHGARRSDYIKTLFLKHPELLSGVQQRVFLQGDKHHLEAEELNGVEFLMTGALPLGDHYADELGLTNRPHQTYLRIDGDGVSDISRIYIDRL